MLDDEYLVFIVTDPQIRLSAGRLHPQSLKLVCDKGISTLRERASDSEVQDTWDEMTRNGKSRQFIGVFRFLVRTIRNSENPRRFGVFDTGEPKRPNHADILAMIASNPGRNELERLKKAASDALSVATGTEFVRASEFREGRFQHLRIP